MAVVNNINQLMTYAVNYGQEANFADLPLYNLACNSSGGCPSAKQQNFCFRDVDRDHRPALVTAAGVADAATLSEQQLDGHLAGVIITLFGTNFNNQNPSYLGPCRYLRHSARRWG